MENRDQKHVAFMRAINVGGRAIVKMSDLHAAFVAAGCTRVRTYIQSGNIVFESSAKHTAPPFERIRIEVRKLLGTEPGIFFRTVRDVERIAKGAPFKAFDAEPGIKLYVAFLSREPARKPSLPLVAPKEALEAFKLKNLEAFIVSRPKPNGFYGFPNTFIEKELGVSATTRNWSTITKILELVRAD